MLQKYRKKCSVCGEYISGSYYTTKDDKLVCAKDYKVGRTNGSYLRTSIVAGRAPLELSMTALARRKDVLLLRVLSAPIHAVRPLVRQRLHPLIAHAHRKIGKFFEAMSVIKMVIESALFMGLANAASLANQIAILKAAATIDRIHLFPIDRGSHCRHRCVLFSRQRGPSPFLLYLPAGFNCYRPATNERPLSIYILNASRRSRLFFLSLPPSSCRHLRILCIARGAAKFGEKGPPTTEQGCLNMLHREISITRATSNFALIQ